MKLYRVPLNNGWIWYGTQAEAKVAAREFKAPWYAIEVPTMPKEAFVNWLNETPIVNDEKPQLDPLQQAELKALKALPDSEIDTSDIPEQSDWTGATRGKFAPQISLTAVEEFIQNAPAAPELARIADNVCWRLKELMSGGNTQ